MKVHEGGARNVENQSQAAHVPESKVIPLQLRQGSPELEKLARDSRRIENCEETVTQPEERVGNLIQ